MENQPIVNSSETVPASSAPTSQPPIPTQVKTNLLIPILSTVLVSAVVFGFGGYYFGTRTIAPQQYANQNQLVPTNSPETTLVQPSSTPTVTSASSNSLKKYTSKFEKLSFQYPSSWVLSPNQPESTIPEADALGIQDPTGKVSIGWISEIDGLGGSCDPNIPFNQKEGEMGAPCPLYEVVDKQKLANADLYYVAYVVTSDGVKYESIFALQDQDGLLTTKRAMAYLLFTGKNNGKFLVKLGGSALKTGTKVEAQNFFTTSEAVQAKNVLLSASY